MRLITSLLILWPCLGLTMHQPFQSFQSFQPTPYSLLYSDVDACTRYNFLPINGNNFREAILFFNLCQQLIHLLPENQRHDYAKHLKREVLMTKNEFKSKNNNKDIAEWLDARIDTLVRELNEIQPDIREKSDFKLESFWPISKMNFFRRNDQKVDSTPRYSGRIMTIQADDTMRADHASKHQDYDDLDQVDDLLMAEEKVNINDIALIGLILGLVSSVSAAMTLLYICYCGAKRAKKRVISSNHQKGGTDYDDKEKLISQRNSRAAVESQVSTKIAKYASGECKLNKSDGRISEHQAFDANCPAKRDEEHDYENMYGEESSMASGQHGRNTYDTEAEYDQGNETLRWDSHDPEVSPVFLQNQAANMQTVTARNGVQGPGHPENGSKFSQSVVKDRSQLGYYVMPINELGQRTKSKDGYGDSNGQKLIYNNFSQQRLNEHTRLSSMSAHIRETGKRSLLGDDKKTDRSLSYIQQKYKKEQVPLMNSHFPCDVQQTQLQQQKSHLPQQLQPSQMDPDQLHLQQLSQLQQERKTTSNSENMKTLVTNSSEKEPTLIYGTNTLQIDETQETNKCKNCKKTVASKKRQGLTCENTSTLIRMQMKASKNNDNLDETQCERTDSEIMRQEKFLCSLSATTPLTTKEPNLKRGDETPSNKSEMSEQVANKMVAKNTSHSAIGDQKSNAQNLLMDKNLTASSDLHLIHVDSRHIGEQKQYYMSLHAPAVKKYHRQKFAHPKSPHAVPRSGKKLTRKMPLQEMNSSYYSVKPGSAYQSCSEMNPLKTPKIDQNTIDTTKNALPAPNIQQKEFPKTLKTMFSKYSCNAKEANNGREKLLKT